MVKVAEEEGEDAKIRIWASPRVEPQHIESHDHDDDGVDKELEECEEGADLRVKDVPHSVYVVNSGKETQVGVISADGCIEAPMLQSLHKEADHGH